MPNTIEYSWGRHCQFFGSLRGICGLFPTLNQVEVEQTIPDNKYIKVKNDKIILKKKV
jgi:hypothetical protein